MKPENTITRRSVMIGATAIAGLSAVPLKATAALYGGVASVAPEPRSATLGRFLCDTVHRRMAVELDEIIADPAIDGERTAIALMKAECPGCGEKVLPAERSLADAIPRWEWDNEEEA